jgi:hypothetical protein
MHCTERHQPKVSQKLDQLWNFCLVFASEMEKDRFVLSWFLILVTLIHYPFQFYCIFSQKNVYLSNLAALSTTVVSLTLEAVALVTGWFLCHKLVDNLHISTMSVIKTIFIFSLLVFLGLNFIHLVVYNSGNYPTDILLEFITIPFIAVAVIKPSFSLKFLSCLITLSVLVFAAGWSRTSESAVVVVVYFLSVCLFIISDSVSIELEEKVDIEAPIPNPDFDNFQMKAMEIRDMIGNVAHDLKTVRICFDLLVSILLIFFFSH